MPKPQPARKPKPQPTSKRSAPRPSRPAKPTRPATPASAPREVLIRIDMIHDLADSVRLSRAKGLDQETVDAYAERYAAGAPMPAIVAFRHADTYLIGDGHHRAAGAIKAKQKTILAHVRDGTPIDAMLYAAGCNDDHGLRRTNADKRMIVTRLLGLDQFKRKSDRHLSTIAHVSANFIGNIRKEIGAKTTEIEKRDGTVQKARGSATKAKPAQQDLFDTDAAGADVQARYAETLAALVHPDSGFAKMNPDKIAILAALHVSPHPLKRKAIAAITGKGPDVHLAGLAKKNLIRGWPDADASIPGGVSQRITAAVTALKQAGSPPNPARASVRAIPPGVDLVVLGAELHRCIVQAAAMFATPPNGPTGADVEKAASYLGITLPPTWYAFADDIDGIVMRDARWYSLREDQPAAAPAESPTTAESPAATGPEDITVDQVAPAAPADPAPEPAADEPAAQQVKPLELRRVDKQREILQHRLLTGKPQWQGGDDDLFLLGLIAGVPTRTVAWIDACRARSRDLFIDALRTEVADRIRTGVAINARIWPQLAELCRLWGLDWQAITIEAERAVPE